MIHKVDVVHVVVITYHFTNVSAATTHKTIIRFAIRLTLKAAEPAVLNDAKLLFALTSKPNLLPPFNKLSIVPAA